MEGGTQNGHPPVVGSSFSFLLSLDGPSNRELAEDWIGDRDGLLVFVRRVFNSTIRARYL